MIRRLLRLALLPLLVLSALIAAPPPPADGPDPREIPLPPLATSLPSLPGVTELPLQPALPDPLVAADGTRITSAAAWPARRAEIRRLLEYYAVGRIPPPPGNLQARELPGELLAGGAVRYRLVRLTFGPDHQLALDVGLFCPAGPGPFPAVILPLGPPPGSTPLPRLPPGPGQGQGVNALLAAGPAVLASTLLPPAPVPTAEALAQPFPEALRRGYAVVVFDHHACGEDTTLRTADGGWAYRTTRFFPAYPDYDWGLLGSWAWGVSRIVDYLVTDPVFDPARLIVSGVSRTGKSALIAGAFDERLALTAPAVSGGGGVGAYRSSGFGRGGKEGLGDMMRKYPNWFSPHLRPFWGHVDRLPFDQHWFLALIAPRPFLALEGTTDGVSLAAAVQQSIRAARPVYALFDATDRLGVNYADHGHTFTPADWTALLDFADLHLRGQPGARRFDVFPAETQQP